MLNRSLRITLGFVGMAGGLAATFYGLGPLQLLLGLEFNTGHVVGLLMLGSAVGSLVGLTLAPWLMERIWQFVSWVEVRLQRTPFQDIVAGAVGLTTGLIIANLLGAAFARIPLAGGFLPTAGTVILGYLGMSVAVKKKEELLSLFVFLPRLAGKDREKGGKTAIPAQPKILDTSVIIDGRIADVCRSGFLEGTMIIPSFVLEELQHIADSSDVLKRNRGRRGLDILNKMQKDMDIRVQIYDRNFNDQQEVDSKLVRLAKLVDGKIITNDFNLNKVAELHGVSVLNINELANSLKPVVLPGEDMVVHVIKDGKESGQGVAYLDDGTMIVVDGGKRHIGETIGVSVTSVLQTAAGRMIFAKPKSPVEKLMS